MNDGQALLERCLLYPFDETARKVFADWLQESGDAELAGAIRGERGNEHLETTRNLSSKLHRVPCVKFLWGAVFVFTADMDHWRAFYEREQASVFRPPSGSLLSLPDGWTNQRTDRSSFSARLRRIFRFGG